MSQYCSKCAPTQQGYDSAQAQMQPYCMIGVGTRSGERPGSRSRRFQACGGNGGFPGPESTGIPRTGAAAGHGSPTHQLSRGQGSHLLPAPAGPEERAAPAVPPCGSLHLHSHCSRQATAAISKMLGKLQLE